MLHRRLEQCHAFLQRALADCSFHDRDLVSRRADALLSHAQDLAAKGRMPASASPYSPLDWLRAWQSEMRSLATLAVKEGADGMTPRPDWDARSFWEGPEPGGNWVELFRLRRHVLAHVDATGIRGPHGLPGLDEMRETRDFLAECEDDLQHPEGLVKLQGALVGLHATGFLVQRGFARLAHSRPDQPRPQ